MDELMKELLKSPRLKITVKELQDVLKEEEKKRQEFYNTITEDEKAEFINGEVIVQSPVKLEHADVSGMLHNLIYNYSVKHDLGSVFAEKGMIHLTRNSYEPDIIFFKKEGAKNFKPDQVIFPVPDFIVEIISSSTEKYDRGIKFTDYALHGVEEYWIADPRNKTIEQYLLAKDKYILELKAKSGVITSKVIRDFSFSIKAAFNKQENLKALVKIVQH